MLFLIIAVVVPVAIAVVGVSSLYRHHCFPFTCCCVGFVAFVVTVHFSEGSIKKEPRLSLPCW